LKKTIIFAHRGASGYCPENTLAAFKKAIQLGATGIETDVQLTKDGRVVIIHDESLARTAGLNQLVKDTDYEELATLDAGGWYGAEFQDERIPTLEQLLELLKPTDIILNIELKNGVFPYPDLEQKVIDMVRNSQMTDRVIISSFNHYSLVLCKQLAPEIRTGILYMEGLYRFKLTHFMRSSMLSHRNGPLKHQLTVLLITPSRLMKQARWSGLSTLA
jgi:glycerophosphoryl diester phosphodiesterase